MAEQVHLLFGRLPRLDSSTPRKSLPANGIYVFFEKGETVRIDGAVHDRIVRVGTHNSDGRFPDRAHLLYSGRRWRRAQLVDVHRDIALRGVCAFAQLPRKAVHFVHDRTGKERLAALLAHSRRHVRENDHPTAVRHGVTYQLIPQPTMTKSAHLNLRHLHGHLLFRKSSDHASGSVSPGGYTVMTQPAVTLNTI